MLSNNIYGHFILKSELKTINYNNPDIRFRITAVLRRTFL